MLPFKFEKVFFLIKSFRLYVFFYFEYFSVFESLCTYMYISYCIHTYIFIYYTKKRFISVDTTILLSRDEYFFCVFILCVQKVGMWLHYIYIYLFNTYRRQMRIVIIPTFGCSFLISLGFQSVNVYVYINI